MIGAEDRTTKDMDATLKGIPLTMVDVGKIFDDILSIDVDDGVSFEIISVKDIRLEDVYGGYRLNILSKLENNKTYITVELTTGDVITPRAMKYNYQCIFDDKRIPIMAYTVETVLAEKLHAIIERGTLTTRLKDYYDIYMLMNGDICKIDLTILGKAIKNTFAKRNLKLDLNNIRQVVEELETSEIMEKLWIDYQRKNSYAKEITYQETVNSIRKVVDILDSEHVFVESIS